NCVKEDNEPGGQKTQMIERRHVMKTSALHTLSYTRPAGDPASKIAAARTSASRHPRSASCNPAHCIAAVSGPAIQPRLRHQHIPKPMAVIARAPHVLAHPALHDARIEQALGVQPRG